jgi:hypothetical protein
METTDRDTRSLNEVVRAVLNENRQATLADALAAWRAEQRDGAHDESDDWSVIVAFEHEQERRGIAVRPAVEPIAAPDWRHTRPLWVVAMLPFAALVGVFYPLVWMGITWAEMKRELEDSDMHPWWHTLGLLVPLYNWAVIYAHFHKIEELSWRAETGSRVYAGWAVLAMIAAGSASLVAQGQRLGNPPLFVGLTLVSTTILAAMLAHGQSALNAYWQKVRGGEAPAHTHWAVWAALVIGIPLQLLGLGAILAMAR